MYNRILVYICFFLSGTTSLAFEILWSHQFVTVFGNSSYAVSVVLCAYMTGIGLGGVFGGRLADLSRSRTATFGAIEIAVAGWAFVMPSLLGALRRLAPGVAALAPHSLLMATLVRFALAFLILAVPCFLIGATFPLLCRILTYSRADIRSRIGALYSWNTLGAASGCILTGCWLLDRFGQRTTNLWLVGASLLIGVVALALPGQRLEGPITTGEECAQQPRVEPNVYISRATDWIPLTVAFMNGLGGLICEVVWFRYLDFLLFLGQPAYVFPEILCIYLVGLGLGGFLFRIYARNRVPSFGALCVTEILLAIVLIASFAVSALSFSFGPPPPIGIKGMALVAVFPPTILMGFAYPLVCSLYSSRLGWELE